MRRFTPPRWLQVLADHKAAEMMLTLVGVGSLILGTVIAAAPDSLAASPTFVNVLRTPTWVWSTALTGPAVWALAAGFLNRRAATVPLLILALVYTAWSFNVAVAIVHGGIPTAVVAYTMIAFACCITAVLCVAQSQP